MRAEIVCAYQTRGQPGRPLAGQTKDATFCVSAQLSWLLAIRTRKLRFENSPLHCKRHGLVYAVGTFNNSGYYQPNKTRDCGEFPIPCARSAIIVAAGDGMPAWQIKTPLRMLKEKRGPKTKEATWYTSRNYTRLM